MEDTAVAGKQSSSGLEFKLHPLVLINISDHYTRTRVNTGAPPAGRDVYVLGCLLGQQSGRSVDISNSFEMKFERAECGSAIIDDSFLLKKQDQYKQVFPRLDLVGWYVTGQGVSDIDMAVNRKIMELNESPVVLLLNPKVDHLQKDLPVMLFETETHVLDGDPTQILVKAAYKVETSDAERIGVDQVAKILPSGKATGSEQLTAHLLGIHSAIKMLNARVGLIKQLLHKIQSGELPFHHGLVRKISSLVHSLPVMDMPEFNKEYLQDCNDTLLTIYLASMTKGVSAMNEIVDKFALAYEKTGGSSRRRPMI